VITSDAADTDINKEKSMGFGLLFIGYFVATLMTINKFGAYIRVIGYAIVAFSASKLNKYNRTFTYLSFSAILMIAVSLLLALSDIMTLFSINSVFVGNSFISIMGYVEMFFSLIFNAVMLYCIRSIAIETDVSKIAVGAIRNLIFICIYYVLTLIGMLPFDFAKEYSVYFSAPVLILYFVWIILNLVLIFSCYSRICDENDIDMVRKPSRFAFVNKMREESEQRQREAAERRAEQKSLKRERKNK